MSVDPIPVDAVLFLSFGGPEGPEEVRPFLENVTRGRGVPSERLDEVAEHYQHFGGVSPINRLNRQLIEELEARLRRAGMDLPVYFGNRNWHPMIEDTVARMAGDGVRRALVFATSAWGGYSGNDQYNEDIVRARKACGDIAPELVKLRQFHDHPLFVAANADAVSAAYRELGVGDARLVCTAHSIPARVDDQQGEDGQPNWYSRQVAEAARLVADAAGARDYDLVWQSRSGPPEVPWLEPDIVDHIERLRATGTRAVVVSPIGFVSDHLEVLWDLDNEASEKADELGIGFVRAATAGADPRFADMILELIREHTDNQQPRKLSALPAAGRSVNGEPVRPGSY